MVQKTTPCCSESPPLPVNFPTVLIAGVSACHKNIQPVQIYLRSPPRTLWLSPNLHSCTHSPLLHVFFNPYQFPLVSPPVDVTQTRKRIETKQNQKKKSWMTVSKPVWRLQGDCTRNKHQQPATAAASVIDHHQRRRWRQRTGLQMTCAAAYAAITREEEIREDCESDAACCLCWSRDGGQMVKWGLRKKEWERDTESSTGANAGTSAARWKHYGKPDELLFIMLSNPYRNTHSLSPSLHLSLSQARLLFLTGALACYLK